MINFDAEDLTRLLGGTPNFVDKVEKLFSTNEFTRMAARVITDSYGTILIENKVSNAVYWINQAYKAGQEEARQKMEKEFKRRILKVFEIKE